jgi:hypothetical protein
VRPFLYEGGGNACVGVLKTVMTLGGNKAPPSLAPAEHVSEKPPHTLANSELLPARRSQRRRMYAGRGLRSRIFSRSIVSY